MNDTELIIKYVIWMLNQNKYTKLKHHLEDALEALPHIDYFKRDAFMDSYFGIKEDTTDAE